MKSVMVGYYRKNFSPSPDMKDFMYMQPETVTFYDDFSNYCNQLYVIDDTIKENEEYVTLCLDIENINNTEYGAINTTTVFIQDNDGKLYCHVLL